MPSCQTILPEIEVYAVSNKETTAIRCFLTDQKILFLAKGIAFFKLENTRNYSTLTDFNRVLPKMANFGISKPIFSYIFSPIILKLYLVI